jgi:hypothetical protein
MIYQRPNTRQRKSAKRLQSGVAGSPLALVDEPKPQRMVLLHFCFDQQNGEPKRESCSCKQRVTFDEAAGFVQQGCADWLLIKNPQSAELVKFRRAVVVRRAVINGEILFAVHNADVKINRRDKKHEQIKATIRTDARTILEKLFSKGLVPHFVVTMKDAQLDDFLSHDKECEDFLTTLSAAVRKRWSKVVTHWWNNVLGYHKLDIYAGKFMISADQGTGEIVFVGGIQELGSVDAAHQMDTGRVASANFRPHFWNEGWLYNSGAGPDSYEEGEGDEPEQVMVSDETTEELFIENT